MMAASLAQAEMSAARPEKVNQIDDQNDHDHQFEDKRAALVKTVHHEPVKIGGDLQFVVDQLAIVRHPEPGRNHSIEAGGIAITQELVGIVNTFCQFLDVEAHRAEAVGFSSQSPACEEATPLLQ